MPRKLSTLAAALLFMLPICASADVVITHNYSATNQIANSHFDLDFPFGTGLTGTVTTYQGVMAAFIVGAGTATISCYTDNAYSIPCSGTNTWLEPITFLGSAATSTADFTSDAIVMNSADYYNIHLNYGGSHLIVYGDNSPNICTSSTCIGSPAFYLFGADAPPSATQITTVTPTSGSTIATSTTATIGATGYILPADYSDGMQIIIKYATYASYQRPVATPEFLYTTYTFPITSSGAFSVSTSTDISQVGQYQMTTAIQGSSYINDALNFLGFGQFATFGFNTSTSTTFTAAHLNSYDVLVASTTAQLQGYIDNASTTAEGCYITSFNVGQCASFIFLPQLSGPFGMGALLTQVQNTLLSFAPWGYVTRFAVIVAGNATTSLPLINIPTPLGNPSQPGFIDGRFTLDPNDMLIGGKDLLNSAHMTFGGETYNIQQVFQPIIDLMVALSVITAVIYDLIGMRQKVKTRSRLH